MIISDIDECVTEPCNMTGTKNCENLENDYFCECNLGFTGRHCDRGNCLQHFFSAKFYFLLSADKNVQKCIRFNGYTKSQITIELMQTE